MKKAPDALRTISEVAEDLQVPNHVLRFWETRFKQIKPMKRGGGRRYYRPGDIDILKGIHHLLYSDGFTIRGVQQILRRDGVDHVKNCWRPDNGVPDVAGETAKIAKSGLSPRKRQNTLGSSHSSSTRHSKLLLNLKAELDGCVEIVEKMRQI